MSGNSYNSLLNHAINVVNEIKKDRKIINLINEIKAEYKIKRNWESELLVKYNKLIKQVEAKSYNIYGHDRPKNIESLNATEEVEFIKYIRKLSGTEKNVNIRVQGNENIDLSSMKDIDLLNSTALRIIPINLKERIKEHSGVNARLTINIHKKYINQLAKELSCLFNEPSFYWLEQAKIMGPRKFGSQTDQAVIYLSQAKTEYAEKIIQQLKSRLPPEAFIEHTPIGMEKLEVGISYSETLTGKPTSHGESRSQLIARAIVESLLTDRPVKQILPNTLQKEGYDPTNPSLAAHVLRDRNLKAGLFSRTLFKNNPASRKIHQFIADPILFSRSNAISGDNMTKTGRIPSHGRAHFVEVAPNSYAIEYRYEPSKISPILAVDAYFLGYNGSNQSSVTPAYVDIPIQAAENSFLFTGSLTGCSVIVTKLNETTYRVYHDGRVNSSVLYDNVVMAFDYKDYKKSRADEGLALVYMYFKDNKWELILQRQEYKVINGKPIPTLRKGEAIECLNANSEFFLENRRKFIEYRNEIHNKIINIANSFDIDATNIIEVEYSGDTFSSQNTAIRPWLNVYDQIKESVEKDISELRSKIELFDNELSLINQKYIKSTSDYSRIKVLKLSIGRNKTTIEFYKTKYLSSLSELLSVERSWLWLKIKDYHGQDKVVKIIDEVVQSGIHVDNNSIDKKYNLAVHDSIWKNNILFNDGRDKYDDIYIPGFNKNMLSREMKVLYIEANLTVEEAGALTQYIELKEKSEFISHVLNMTSKIDLLFKEAGCIDKRTMPQDFYLPLMGDNSGGRCYSLVRVMSVALASGAEKGANKLLDKMFFAGASPKKQESILLKLALENLHSNIEATQASTTIGHFNLNEIKSMLVECVDIKIYAINSQTHSMLLGKTIKNSEVRYYFYDPNFGVYIFDDSEKLFSALNKFMVEKNMAQQYSVLDGKFELIEIDTGLMSNVQVGSSLIVADLVYSDDLAESLHNNKQMRIITDNQKLIVKDKKNQASFEILKAAQWGSRLESALSNLMEQHQLDQKWLPIFKNIEVLENSQYRLQFIHQDDDEGSRWVETDDRTFLEFKEYFDKSIENFKCYYSFDGQELQPKDINGDPEHADGLNIAMGVQVLIQWSANRNRQSVSSGSLSNLETALRIHCYVSYSMMAHGTINDAVKVTKLVRTLWQNGAGVEKIAMNNFSLSFLQKANEKLGAIFQGAMVVFDIYELENAENGQQKAVFGTQLAFDSAALATSAISYGASILGAETAASFTGLLAIPITGLGIGLGELIRENAYRAEKAAAVGTEFAMYKQNYQNAKIAYDTKIKILTPTPKIVIEKIDFKRKYFELGSQYIYRGEERAWNFHHSWLSDFQPSPKVDIDKNNAINIREAVGVTDIEVNFDTTQSYIVALPIVPKSYINYRYSIVFGATSREDNGFSVLRKMEEGYQFYFDFFYCAAEYVISELVHEYIDTKIEVILEPGYKHLIIPTLPEPWKGYIDYIVKGDGGSYTISVNYGASLKLIDSSINSSKSEWVIDTSLIDNEINIQIFDDYIKLGEITIYIDTTAKSNIIKVVNSKHEINEINFINKTIKFVSLDARKWTDKGQSIEQNMNDLADKNKLNGKYVLINNYQHNGLDVGRAFYEVATRRILFSYSSGEEKYSTGLLGVVDDTVYFYSSTKSIIWQVNAKTGNIINELDPSLILGDGVKITQALLKDNQLYFKLSKDHNGLMIESSYRMIGNKLELLSISNDMELVQKLFNSPTTIPVEKRQEFYKNNYLVYIDDIDYRELYLTIEPSLAKMVMISGSDQGYIRRYWLRIDDWTLVKPNLERPDGYDQELSSLFLKRVHLNSQQIKEIDLLLANDKFSVMWVLEECDIYIPKEDALLVDRLFKENGVKLKLDKMLGVIDGMYDLETDQWKWEPPQDLILVGSLFSEDKKEIFFFYSKQENTIFRQEGLGQNIIDLRNPTGKRLVFDKIKTVLNWQNNIIVVLDNGVVKQLNADGSANMVALNNMWFERTSFKWSDLDNYSNENQPIALFGLKATDGKHFLPAWYFNGKVVIAHSLSSEDVLQFLGFDQKCQSGIIFDTQSKILYQQDALTIEQLADIFGENTTFKHPESLPTSRKLYPELKFKKIQKIADGLMLLTENDEIIYYPISDNTQIYSSFIIQGTVNNDILKPRKLVNVSNLALSGGEGKDTYQINQEDWAGYETIIIDNYALDKVIDTIVLPIKDQLGSIIINREKNDLFITDPIDKTSLILREFYGKKSEQYRHIQLNIEGTKEYIDLGLIAEHPQTQRSFIYLSDFMQSTDSTMSLQRADDTSLLTESLNGIIQKDSASEVKKINYRSELHYSGGFIPSMIKY